MGKALHYAHDQWPHLHACFQHGHIDFDNNSVENAIRPTKLGAKNWMFVGGKDTGWRSFYKLKRGAAPGVDGVSFEQYEANLEANLGNLVERLKGKRHRAKLVRRKFIPKTGGKLRPLGIPARKRPTEPLYPGAA